MRDPADECYRRRQPKTMNDEVRFELIRDLRRRGWTWKKIGQCVGLSDTGAKRAYARIASPGRYYGGPTDGEVDDATALEEW
jgi:hypothetical protein